MKKFIKTSAFVWLYIFPIICMELSFNSNLREYNHPIDQALHQSLNQQLIGENDTFIAANSGLPDQPLPVNIDTIEDIQDLQLKIAVETRDIALIKLLLNDKRNSNIDAAMQPLYNQAHKLILENDASDTGNPLKRKADFNNSYAESKIAKTRKPTGKKSHVCNYDRCGNSFTRLINLKKHITSIHLGQKPYKCKHEGCEKSFADRTTLKDHIRSHTEEEPYICGFEGCKQSFSTRNSRKRDIRTHTNERPYSCKFCKSTFTQSSALNRHNKAKHEGIAPCARYNQFCQKSFSHKEALEEHKQMQAIERPHICNYPGCNKHFYTAKDLKKHHVTHSDGKPYKGNIWFILNHS